MGASYAREGPSFANWNYFVSVEAFRPLHLKDTPDVAPSWLLLFNFAVLSLRHLNEPPRIRKIGRQRSFSVSGPFSGFA